MSDQDRPPIERTLWLVAPRFKNASSASRLSKRIVAKKHIGLKQRPVRLWSVMLGAPKRSKSLPAAVPYVQIFSLLVGEIGRWTSTTASNLTQAAASGDTQLGRFHRSRGTMIAREGEACLPIFSVAGARRHGFRCLHEMLSQIFYRDHCHRRWRLGVPLTPLSHGVHVSPREFVAPRMNRIGKQSGSR